jgi:hypothetical protein
MSYSLGGRRIYSYPSVNFGGGDSTQSFRGPRGKTGHLRWIHTTATTAYAGATTTPKIQVGISGTLTQKANWDTGTLAITLSKSSDDSQQTSNPITDENLAADVDYLVTFKAPTGGGAAGVGHVQICVDWAD